MRILPFIFAVFLSGTAAAAAPIYQNRDEPGRNPYQVQASANCNAKTACTLKFPTISGKRIVIETVNCDLFLNRYDGDVTVTLQTAKKALHQIFDAPTYFLSAQTRFYVEPADAPLIQLQSIYNFKGTQSCTLTGYTIAQP
jgi:hypothetical protein